MSISGSSSLYSSSSTINNNQKQQQQDLLLRSAANEMIDGNNIEEYYYDSKNSTTVPQRTSFSVYYDINSPIQQQQVPATVYLPTNIRKSSSSSITSSNSQAKNIPINFVPNEYATATTNTSTKSPHLSIPQLKCSRCDKLTRKFESVINCTNPSCDKLFHKRCVIFPYASNEQDKFWKCDDCETNQENRKAYKQQSVLMKSGTSLRSPQTIRPALTHSNTTSSLSSGLPSFKYEDGRTHICNKLHHTPRSSKRNHYHSRDSTNTNTNSSNTPVLSRRSNNSASVGSLSKAGPTKATNPFGSCESNIDSYNTNATSFYFDETKSSNENDLQLKLAQVLDISNDFNGTVDTCQELDTSKQSYNQTTSNALKLLPSVIDDNQNKIFVKLNIRMLDDDDDNEIKKNSNYEFVLNDNKNVLKHSSNKQPLSESRKSSQSDASNNNNNNSNTAMKRKTLKAEKQKILDEIEINEDMIKNFDQQFENLVSNGVASKFTTPSNANNNGLLKIANNSKQFQTYEESTAYINGQRKASSSSGGQEATNWILKTTTTTTEPPFLFRYNKTEDKLPQTQNGYFHFTANDNERVDDHDDDEVDVEIEEDNVEQEEEEEEEEKLSNDSPYNKKNNQLINYDNEEQAKINLINFNLFNSNNEINSNEINQNKENLLKITPPKYKQEEEEGESRKQKITGNYFITHDDNNMTNSINEEDITVIHQNKKPNYSPVVSISPIPVPPPPPSNMTSFQQLKAGDATSKTPSTATPVQTSHPVDVVRMKEMERKIIDQDEKLRLQEEKIDELTNVIKKMRKDFEEQHEQQQDEIQKNVGLPKRKENEIKNNKQDAFVVARNEGINDDDGWRISLIDDLSLVFAKYLGPTANRNETSTNANKKIEEDINKPNTNKLDSTLAEQSNKEMASMIISSIMQGKKEDNKDKQSNSEISHQEQQNPLKVENENSYNLGGLIQKLVLHPNLSNQQIDKVAENANIEKQKPQKVETENSSHVGGLIEKLTIHPKLPNQQVEKGSEKTLEPKKPEKVENENNSHLGGLIQHLVIQPKLPNQQIEKGSEKTVEQRVPEKVENENNSNLGGLIQKLVIYPKLPTQQVAENAKIEQQKSQKVENENNSHLGGLIQQLVIHPKLPNQQVEKGAVEPKKTEKVENENNSNLGGLIQQLVIHPKLPNQTNNTQLGGQNDQKEKRIETKNDSYLDGALQQLIIHPKLTEQKSQKGNERNGSENKSHIEDLLQQLLVHANQPEQQQSDRNENEKSMKTINDLLLQSNHTNDTDSLKINKPVQKDERSGSVVVSQLIASLETKNHQSESESKQQSKVKKSDSTKASTKNQPEPKSQQTPQKSNLSKSEMNLRHNVNEDDGNDSDLGNTSIGHNSRIDKTNIKAQSTTFRASSSNERSPSALATLSNDSNSTANTLERPYHKDTIYENVNSLSAESIQKASKKGYLERKHFDKIFKTSEKLYCVLDGSSMHFYKKETDKKKIKVLSLTGSKIKTADDYPLDQITNKKSPTFLHFKNPKAFEICQSSKTYQFVAPSKDEFDSWLTALRGACSINYQFNFNSVPKEYLTNEYQSISNDRADLYNSFVQENKNNII